MIDLSLLPAPSIVEALDYETILAQRKAALAALFSGDTQAAVIATLALESEPLTKLLEENTYRELLLRQRINNGCHAVMLAYATGTDLDNLAAFWNVQRLLIQAGDPTHVPPIPPYYETDERLRSRTQMAMEGLTVAGSRGSYVFHALSASARVADCSVVGPELIWIDGTATSTNGVPPGVVMVYLLDTQNNGVPDDGLVSTVAAYLSDETRRPLCDTVIVEGAQIVDYAIAANVYIYPGPSAAPVMAQATANAQAFAVANFRLGRDVRLSALYGHLFVEGMQRIDLAQPAADLVIAANQAARCTGISLNLAGRDV
jgi:phage-related baseplate assembly protein